MANQDFHELLFDVRRSIRYHSRRQAEAIASAGGRADAQTAVSANLAMLKTDMATIKADIAWLKANAAAERSELRWMFGFLFALLLVVAARVFAIV